MKKPKLIGAILYSVQLALSAVLVFYIFKLNVLPDSVVFGCVLVLSSCLPAPGAFLLFLKGTAKKIICACISLILSILLLIPIRVFRKTDSTLTTFRGKRTRLIEL